MTRSKVLRIILFVAVGVITLRLFMIQVVEHEKYVELAEEQQVMQKVIVPTRGEIYMMDGETKTAAVVMNEPVWTVLVDPMVADEDAVKETVNKYAKDLMVFSWEEIFANKNSRYQVIARKVPRDAATKIKEENPTGVWLQETVRRVYTEGQMASSLLGFVNADGEGQYGVEGALNEELKGKNGVLKTVKDVNNIPLTIGNDNVRVAAEDGKNIVLTVDRNVQRKVEQILQGAMDKFGAANTAALVMNPQTGEILAMANLPTYDATNYGAVTDASVFQNEVLDVAFEPASVCKTFSFSAAVNEGLMTPDTTYYNPGYFTIDGWEIANAEKGQLGQITMQTALNYSLNTGSMQALMWLGGNPSAITQAGREKLFEYYHDRFGLGEATGIELFESTGLIIRPNEEGYYGLDSLYANMTFGQNLSLTMMQTAAAFSSVINGGYYYTPTIIAGEMKDGEFIQRDIQEPVRQTVTAETSATMRKMLWGTRSYRRLYGIDKAGYFVGGKTGTAQVIRDGKYVMDETQATYIGFGATGNEEQSDLPEYVVMVKIWEEGKTFDGQSNALPIFDEISNYLQDYLRMAPKGVN